jgi:hypothetical protein
MPQVGSNDLAVNKPIEGAAPDATLVININRDAPLRVGSYRFQLVVFDEAGRASAPVTHALVVADSQNPNAVITGPREVPFLENFTLSGERSSDPDGGRIVRYVWTLVEAP